MSARAAAAIGISHCQAERAYPALVFFFGDISPEAVFRCGEKTFNYNGVGEALHVLHRRPFRRPALPLQKTAASGFDIITIKSVLLYATDVSSPSPSAGGFLRERDDLHLNGGADGLEFLQAHSEWG